MRHALPLALLLAGCTQLPSAMRPATSEETRAVGSLWVSWAQSGRAVPECPVLEHVEVARLDQEEVVGHCGQPVGSRISACVIVAQRHAFDFPGRAFMYVDASVTPDEHLRLVIHEAAHVLRSCWVGMDVYDGFHDRYYTGQDESCRVVGQADFFHCDSDLWRGIVRDAWGRLEDQ